MMGLGEKVENPTLAQKILRSFPMRFDSNFSAFKEGKDLYKLSMDELHGILIVYDMRTKHENPSREKVAFKASKKTKKNNKNLAHVLVVVKTQMMKKKLNF